jgi:hypothetical protein
MANPFLTFKCLHCDDDRLVWRSYPSTDSPPYKVTCCDCGKLAGWGSEAERQELLEAGREIETVEGGLDEPSATLIDWLYD